MGRSWDNTKKYCAKLWADMIEPFVVHIVVAGCLLGSVWLLSQVAERLAPKELVNEIKALDRVVSLGLLVIMSIYLAVILGSQAYFNVAGHFARLSSDYRRERRRLEIESRPTITPPDQPDQEEGTTAEPIREPSTVTLPDQANLNNGTTAAPTEEPSTVTPPDQPDQEDGTTTEQIRERYAKGTSDSPSEQEIGNE
jgi:hypothetical protein